MRRVLGIVSFFVLILRNLFRQHPDRDENRPAELSGGERHGSPSRALADQPTGSLDSSAGKRILELIAHLRQERELTVVMVTHDLSVAGRADRTISMLGGRLADALTPTSIELSDVSADVGSV